MRTILFVSILLLTIMNHSDASDRFSFISLGKVIIYDLGDHRFHEIKAPFNIFDYELAQNELFAVTTSDTGAGHYLYNKPQITHLYRSRIYPPDNSRDHVFSEINIRSVSSIKLSPDNNALLITSLSDSICYSVLDLKNNTLYRHEKLTNHDVLGWYSNNEVLAIIDKRVFIYEISKHHFRIFQNKLNNDNNKIINFKRIDEQNTIFQLKVDTLNQVNLVLNFNGHTKKIYSIQSNYLDYILDNKEIILLETWHNDVERRRDMIEMNLNGGILKRTNLDELLQLQPDFQNIKFSENIMNNNLIVFVINPWHSNFYRVNVNNLTYNRLDTGDRYFAEVIKLREFAYDN